METISRHELVPFTALMNMIKFNYMDKKEVFLTLLSVLGDYDPTDEENKKRTTRYIELLLTDQQELAEYLVSFLPNGLCIDHIGMSDIKDDTNKLKLKKKKTDKLYQSSTSAPGPTPIAAETSMSECNKDPVLQTPSLEPQKTIDLTATNLKSKDLPKIDVKIKDLPVTDIKTKDLPTNFKTKAHIIIKSSKTDLVKVESCKTEEKSSVIVTQGNSLIGPENPQVAPQTTSNKSLQGKGQNVKQGQSNLTPVCPVVPSLKLQNTVTTDVGKSFHGNTNSMVTTKKTTADVNKTLHCNVNPLFTARQHIGEWIPIAPENLTLLHPSPNLVPQKQGLVPAHQGLREIPGQNLPPAHQGLREIPNRFSSNFVNASSVASKPDVVQDCSNVVMNATSFQATRQPLLPSLRFPMHSIHRPEGPAPMPGIPNLDLQQLEHFFNRDLVQDYQKSSILAHSSSNIQHFVNSRNLSVFPYTQEFIFKNGTTQNLLVNNTNVQGQREITHQPTSVHTNMYVPPYNQNQLQSVGQQQSLIHIPMKSNITYTNTQTTTIPIKNTAQQNMHMPYHGNYGNSTTHTITQSHFSTTTLQTRMSGSFPQLLPLQAPYRTPTQSLQNSDDRVREILDFMTPEQYNPDLGTQPSSDMVDTGGVKTKPKKLSMTANSAVRKKLKLTPNNNNLPTQP